MEAYEARSLLARVDKLRASTHGHKVFPDEEQALLLVGEYFIRARLSVRNQANLFAVEPLANGSL